MVLYHATTLLHILYFALHRVNYRKDTHAVIVVTEFLSQNGKLLSRLQENKFFDEIRVLRNRIRSSRNYEEVISGIEADVSISLPDIELFDEINIAGTQYYFSLWCIKSGIRFNFFEEAAGRLTDPEMLRKGVRSSGSLLQDELAEKHGMYTGRSEWVKNIYCKIDAQDLSLIQEEERSKLKDFDVLKELGNLPDEYKCVIPTCFGVPAEIEIPDNSFLVLTQHFHNLRMLSFEEQAELYQSTADYYLEGIPLVYKPHPSDLHYYSSLTPNTNVIRGIFPMELMLMSFSQNPLGVAAICSTGINNIERRFQKRLVFNDLYVNTFKGNHMYYFFLNLAGRLSLDGSEICAVGANMRQLNNLSEYAFGGKFAGISGDSHDHAALYMIDNANDTDIRVSDFISSIPDEAVVLFTNSNMRFAFFESYVLNADRSIVDNIIPKRIEICPIAEEVYADTGTQVVYLYTKSPAMRKELQSMSYEKTLTYSGIQTRVPENTDKDTQIAVLSGILEATEKRLLYYINREKELLEKLSKK